MPKREGIAKKLILTLRTIMKTQEVDLVAGDFDGTGCRYGGKDKSQYDGRSIYGQYLAHATGPHTTVGDLDPFRDNLADVCGFLKPAGFDRFWKVHKHGAFSSLEKHLA